VGLRSKIYIWLKIAKANTPHLRRLRLLKLSPSVERYGARQVMDAAAGNLMLLDHVANNRPIAAGKIGDTELEVLVKFEAFRDDPGAFFRSITDDGHEFELLYLNCGVFPKREDILTRWTNTYLEAVSNMDLLGVWYNKGEEQIVTKYATSAALTTITAVEPYYHESPWTQALEGKRVLVVSPFEDSILRQRARFSGRDLFPDNPAVFPNFELTVVRSPFSAALVAPNHKDWHAALAHMEARIAAVDFDVCLVGAGAYSLPICSFVRTDLRRSAVHLGGAMQIFFGIKGRRWDAHPTISKLFNENWARPLAHERPKRRWKNDGGAYW
jgi:hypothetical protein